MYEYLTDEDLETAKKNGINKDIAYQRFYVRGWDKERAITQPVARKKKGQYTEWKDIALKNGISDTCFINRIKRQGMTPEQAATIPLWTKMEIIENTNRKRMAKSRITPQNRQRAYENGISKHALYARVYRLKWDIERACTEPPGTVKVWLQHKTK